MLAVMEMEATTMASNVYTNLTPAAALDKKTLNKMVWRSLNLQASFNYERMQAAGWLYGILPGLEKIHTDEEDLKLSMAHNLEFFNTHPFLVTFVMGIILSLEQQKADINTIRAVRVAAMGPLGGIGDAIFWFTLVPIAAGIAEEMALSGATGFTSSTPFITAIIVGGSFFGDNLSFISDTTIAATRTQECSMTDKLKVNLKIVGPAAIIVTIIYIILGTSACATPQTGPIDWTLLIPYVLVIVLALSGINVIAVLGVGIVVNGILGFTGGCFAWSGFLEAIGSGISGMGDLIIVTLLAGGMLELIRINGGLDYIVEVMTRRIKGKRGAEFSIAALVSLANLCTANNTIAIITVGRIAKDISEKFGIDPRKSASLLDTFSCLIQGLIPYGAQLLMAAGLAGISSISIIGYLYYPVVMGLCAVLAIIFRLPRRYS